MVMQIAFQPKYKDAHRLLWNKDAEKKILN